MRGGVALFAAGCLAASVGAADVARYVGHGGPVKGVDVSASDETLLTASFDNSVGYWNGSGAPVWLEGHRAAVNTVLFLGEGQAASAGDDFDIWLWDLEAGTGEALPGHQGKIIDLALSPDRRLLASASWDGSIGLWPLDGGAPRFLTGHQSNVNAVAFTADGARLYSASADGTLRLWDVETGSELRRVLSHGFGINTLVLAEARGWLAYGAVDGGTRVVSLADDSLLADLTAERRPVLAMAASPDLDELAIGDGEGFILMVDTRDWSVNRDFRAAARGPIWALDYSRDGTQILGGGLDDALHAWPVEDPGAGPKLAATERTFLKDPDSMSNGERQFQRKCSICHVLTGDSARRAGPTLEGVFGRRAGTVPGYRYSATLTGSDLVWSRETIDALFDLGPDHYIPGSKMPMQRITGAQDREDLIDFLARATQTEGTRP